MMNLTIAEIVSACHGKYIGKEENLTKQITGAIMDSRQIEEGGLFLAVPGERVDGHRFVSQVFRNKAALAVCQKTEEQVRNLYGEDTPWGDYILVENTLEALKQIASYYRVKTGIKIIGIAGSVGKTSTKEFVAGVLATKFRVLKTEGNYNNEIGVPLTLLRIRSEHELAVVEMGISDFGEMHRLSAMVKPDICLMTNIGQCHLENLKTRDGILKAKSEIFDFMAEDGEIVLNGDDDKLITIEQVKGHIPHFFGMKNSEKEEVYAHCVEAHGLLGSNAVMKVGDHEIPVHVPLPGEHMVMNAAAATCVAELMGLSSKEIERGIANITPVSGRNHLIPCRDYTIIDDCYNANPVSMKAAIDLLTLADTEKVAILGDMFELGENSDKLHAQVGEYAAEKGIDRILCVGEHSFQMYEAACNAASGSKQIVHFPNLKALTDCLKENREDYVPDYSTVLVKASHGMKLTEVVDLLQKLSL